MPPRFIYFDLGNVLLDFDHHRAARQMAEVAGVATERVWQAVFESPLELDFEAGRIDSRQFYEALVQALGVRPDYDRLALAASAIFEVNPRVLGIAAQLRAAGYRLGVLSNTCALHWEYVTSGRYAMFPETFEVHALSYRIGALKPDVAMFRAAAELAGVPPDAIFYVDDIPGHVEGARAAGFDAVVYTDPWTLADDLRARGVAFNY